MKRVGSSRRVAMRVLPAWSYPYLRRITRLITRWVGHIGRILPGNSLIYGPPRRISSGLIDYVQRYGASAPATYTPVFAVEHAQRLQDPWSQDGRALAVFEAERERTLPAAGVAEIAGGRFITDSGIVIAPPDVLLSDVSDTFGVGTGKDHPIFKSFLLPRPAHRTARVAIIAGYRSDIYYHWLYDTLTRLHLLIESGVEYDYVQVPQSTPFQIQSTRWLIETGQLTREQIGPPGEAISADTLIVPSQCGSAGNPTCWGCAGLRKIFSGLLDKLEGGPAFIYISRQRTATRRVDNEEDVWNTLQRSGFVRIFLEELSFEDQVRLFAQARLIVTPHGSGESNIAFCKPGTVLLELFSPQYVNALYYSICNIVGIRYGYIIGEGNLTKTNFVHNSMRIDMEKLRCGLDWAFNCLNLPELQR